MPADNPTDPKPRWVAVAAMAENRVIGRDGRLPWHLPEDLKFFKQLTVGGAVLMGRKTFASIGRPLPRRRNLVLSRSGFVAPGVEVYGDVREMEKTVPDGETIFVIGGSDIYRLTLPLWDELYLTRVKGDFEGDAFMPAFEDRFGEKETLRETEEFAIIRYH